MIFYNDNQQAIGIKWIVLLVIITIVIVIIHGCLSENTIDIFDFYGFAILLIMLYGLAHNVELIKYDNNLVIKKSFSLNSIEVDKIVSVRLIIVSRNPIYTVIIIKTNNGYLKHNKYYYYGVNKLFARDSELLLFFINHRINCKIGIRGIN